VIVNVIGVGGRRYRERSASSLSEMRLRVEGTPGILVPIHADDETVVMDGAPELFG